MEAGPYGESLQRGIGIVGETVDRTIGSRPKGFPLRGESDIGWSIFDDDIPYPIAVMLESALANNGATMREFCTRNGVDLAPHGKTTMSPELFRRQLADGAWAITAATTWQAKTMWEQGVSRVLIANEVVAPGEVEWLAQARAEGFDVICYVDSVAGVAIFDEVLGRAGSDQPFPVLVEMGLAGGRAGVRSVPEGLAVAGAVAASPHLTLIGTAGFEGIITAEGEQSAQNLVDEFLDQIVELTREINGRGWFEPGSDVVVTAGGSAFFDRVVDRFSVLATDLPLRVVIRSGCYLSHDDGSLHRASPMGEVGRTGHDDFLIPAIEIWGVVLSRPEPMRAIVGVGKRDASSDGLLPVVKKVRRLGSSKIEAVPEFRVSALNDQHAYLDLDPDDELAVGDLMAFGISHPCTTFDKWRVIPIVNDDYRVISLAHTMF